MASITFITTYIELGFRSFSIWNLYQLGNHFVRRDLGHRRRHDANCRRGFSWGWLARNTDQIRINFFVICNGYCLWHVTLGTEGQIYLRDRQFFILNFSTYRINYSIPHKFLYVPRFMRGIQNDILRCRGAFL
ncbi:hypothetical protein FOLKNPGA_01001 [Legionella sp. PC1000]|nr:hypothetical protein FOLKNPGA_01001 [Legionella sp. PC1000]